MPGPLATRRPAGMFLALFLVLSLLLGACTGDDDASPPPPTADELARAAAAGDAAALLTSARRLAASDTGLKSLATSVVAVHEAHLEALGASIPTASATASASPTASAAKVTGETQRKAEWAAAGRALGAARTASPDLALLLTRIAAARAVDSDLIGKAVGKGAVAARLAGTDPEPTASGTASATTASTSPSTPTTAATPTDTSTADVGALQSLLAGEHAAVFAFAVVTARVDDAHRTLALNSWNGHIAARDALEDAIVALGATPVAAQPAYDVGTPPSSPTEADDLAVRVETNLTAIAAGAVVDSTGEAREVTTSSLVEGARRIARWDPAPVALPGTTAEATATPTPS